jgi:hypothetical protein
LPARLNLFLPARSVEKAPATATHAPVDLDTIEDDFGFLTGTRAENEWLQR